MAGGRRVLFLSWSSSPAARAGGGVVRLVVHDAVPICFDRSHLHQVLWNLVSNALRHSSGGQGRCGSCAEQGQRRPGRIACDRRRPGYSRDGARADFRALLHHAYQGTGLGLFIARELCATNGASLELAPHRAGRISLLQGETTRVSCQNRTAPARRTGAGCSSSTTSPTSAN